MFFVSFLFYRKKTAVKIDLSTKRFYISRKLYPKNFVCYHTTLEKQKANMQLKGIQLPSFFQYRSLFNRDLNRVCLIYMFSLRFSGSKFLINLRWQFCVRKNFFVYVKLFVHKFLLDLQSFHFVFKITISKMHKFYSRLLFH